MFTFSVHCGKNFPLRKQQSDLDIAMEDGLEDKDYISTGTSTQDIIIGVKLYVSNVLSLNSFSVVKSPKSQFESHSFPKFIHLFLFE